MDNMKADPTPVIEHTGEPDCPACKAQKDLAYKLRDVMNGANGLTASDRIESMLRMAALITIDQGRANGTKPLPLIRAVAHYAIDHYAKVALSYLNAVEPMSVTEDMVTELKATFGKDPDAADDTDGAWATAAGISDRRAAGVRRPDDPLNLHRRRDDLDIHDRNMIRALKGSKLIH